MKFLPYENYDLKTNLGADEVQKRLADNIEPKKFIRSTLPGFISQKPYEGKITGNTFQCNRIIVHRNSFMPIIHGKFESDSTGTKIYITMRMVLFIYLFMAVWFGGILVWFYLALAQNISGKASSMWICALPMLAAGYGLMIWGFKSEANQSKKFLADLLQAVQVE